MTTYSHPGKPKPAIDARIWLAAAHRFADVAEAALAGEHEGRFTAAIHDLHRVAAELRELVETW